MEEQIKRVTLFNRNVYALFWLLPIAVVVAGETADGWVGSFADDVRATYLAETAAILLTAVCVPLSLKLFSWAMTRKVDTVSFPRALALYKRWSLLRLFLLAMPLMGGLLVYYAMLSTTGVLCAFIALTASLFCVPGEERLRKEFRINKEEDEV